MIAIVKESCSHDQRHVQDRFLAMLPVIERQARRAFRGLPIAEREELTQEVVANAYCAYVGLARRGKDHLTFPSALARYAVKHVRAGRRVGSRFNRHDFLSRHAQQRHAIRVESLDEVDLDVGSWKSALVEDRHVGPAETACARLDFDSWLRSLPSRNRRVAKLLASGETTGTAARRFGVTAGRISQLRSEFERSWATFQGEPMVTDRTAAAA